MKIFWTSIFWLVVFFLVIFYLKTFDDTVGARFASWLSSSAVVVTGNVLSGTQDPVLSGLTTLQTSVDTLEAKLGDIANKLGITAVVTTGTQTPVATGATTGTNKK